MQAEQSLRPGWLRPVVLVAVVVAHVLAFAVHLAAPVTSSPEDALEVALVQEGDADLDQKKQDEVKHATSPQSSSVIQPAQNASPDTASQPMQKPVSQPQDHRAPRPEKQESRKGAPTRIAAPGLSRAAYSSLLVSEINRHRFYPAAAKSAGLQGTVGVAFTIGPAGRLTRVAITRTSGQTILDNAALTTLRAITTPPPPGGRFSTSTNINFHFD